MSDAALRTMPALAPGPYDHAGATGAARGK
jgi:hypothetical protein